jgi:hypothetical protein
MGVIGAVPVSAKFYERASTGFGPCQVSNRQPHFDCRQHAGDWDGGTEAPRPLRWSYIVPRGSWFAVSRKLGHSTLTTS